MRETGLILTIILVLAVSVSAQDAGVESVFDPGAGGRMTALAGACAAADGDSTVLVANPAGLSTIRSSEIQAFFAAYPFATPYASVVLGYPTSRFGVFGGAILHVGTGNIVFTDEENIVTAGEQSFSRTLIMASYASGIPSLPVSLGASLKLDVLRSGSLSDTGLSIDLGLRLNAWGQEWRRWFGKYSVENLAFGLSLREVLSTGTRLGNRLETGAFSVKTGFGYFFLVRNNPSHGITTLLDFDFHLRKLPKPMGGVEYNLFRNYFIRMGYGTDPGLTAGAGASWTLRPGHRLRFDYAFGWPDIGPVHKISATYGFGATVEERRTGEEARRIEEFNRKISEVLEQERRSTDDKLRKMREDLEAEQETNRRAEIQRKLDQALQLERQSADERIEQLRKEHARELTNLGQSYQQELKQTVESSRKKADSDRKKAVQEEKTRAQKRERQIREEQGKLSQDLLKAQSLLFDSEDFDSAIPLLEDILRRDPGNQEAQQYLARAKGGKIPPSAYPAEVQEAINRGMNLLVKENKREEAIRVWEEALAKYPDNWRLFKLIRDAKKKSPQSQERRP